MTDQKPSFEADLAKLETLADQMEQGEMPLETLMDAYEKGAKLAKRLETRLKTAAARLHEVGQSADGNITVEKSEVARQESILDDAEE